MSTPPEHSPENAASPEPSAWARRMVTNPEHSVWYRDRWRAMQAAGDDIFGEARYVDAMVERGSRVLDAGCGSGRIGGWLAERGHTVVGVDVDPLLIEAAEEDYPGPTWLVGDLAAMDLPARGVVEPFDVIVCAGNVMTFLAPSTRTDVLARFASHLAEEGRAVIGFGAGRGYDFDAFFADAQAAGLERDLLLSTWDLRPFEPNSDYLVATFTRA